MEKSLGESDEKKVKEAHPVEYFEESDDDEAIIEDLSTDSGDDTDCDISDLDDDCDWGQESQPKENLEEIMLVSLQDLAIVSSTEESMNCPLLSDNHPSNGSSEPIDPPNSGSDMENANVVVAPYERAFASNPVCSWDLLFWNIQKKKMSHAWKLNEAKVLDSEAIESQRQNLPLATKLEVKLVEQSSPNWWNCWGMLRSRSPPDKVRIPTLENEESGGQMNWSGGTQENLNAGRFLENTSGSSMEVDFQPNLFLARTSSVANIYQPKRPIFYISSHSESSEENSSEIEFSQPKRLSQVKGEGKIMSQPLDVILENRQQKKTKSTTIGKLVREKLILRKMRKVGPSDTTMPCPSKNVHWKESLDISEYFGLGSQNDPTNKSLSGNEMTIPESRQSQIYLVTQDDLKISYSKLVEPERSGGKKFKDFFRNEMPKSPQNRIGNSNKEKEVSCFSGIRRMVRKKWLSLRVRMSSDMGFYSGSSCSWTTPSNSGRPLSQDYTSWPSGSTSLKTTSQEFENFQPDMRSSSSSTWTWNCPTPTSSTDEDLKENETKKGYSKESIESVSNGAAETTKRKIVKIRRKRKKNEKEV